MKNNNNNNNNNNFLELKIYIYKSLESFTLHFTYMGINPVTFSLLDFHVFALLPSSRQCIAPSVKRKDELALLTLIFVSKYVNEGTTGC